MKVKRTKHRLLYPLWEFETLYHIKKDALPDCMELLPDGIHVAIYLTDEQAKERDGQLFPRCPVTGAFCRWDSDYESLGDLF